LVAADSLAGTIDLLSRWGSMSAAERHTMGNSARNLFHSRFTVDSMAESLLAVIGAERRP
jgi:hypothetical protein